MDARTLLNYGHAVTHNLFFWNTTPTALSSLPMSTAAYTQWCKQCFIELGLKPPPRPAHEFRHIANMFAYYCKLTTEEREHFGWAQGTGKQAGQQQTSYNHKNVPIVALRKLALRGQSDQWPFWAAAHLFVPPEVFDDITLGTITGATDMLNNPDWVKAVKSQHLYDEAHDFVQEFQLVAFFDATTRAVIQDSTQLPDGYWEHVVYQHAGWHTTASKTWRARNTPGVRYLQAHHAQYREMRTWEEGVPVRLEIQPPPDFHLPGLSFVVATTLPRMLAAPVASSLFLENGSPHQLLPPPQRTTSNFPSNLLMAPTGTLVRSATLPPASGAMDEVEEREKRKQHKRQQEIVDAACRLYYERPKAAKGTPKPATKAEARRRETCALQAYLHWLGWGAEDAKHMPGWPPCTARGLSITRTRMKSLSIFSTAGGYGERRQSIHKFVNLVMATHNMGRDEACTWADRERLKIVGDQNRILTGNWIEQLLPKLSTTLVAFRAEGKWKQ
jgi:hypothetical protein